MMRVRQHQIELDICEQEFTYC